MDKACPLCGSSDFEVVSDRDRHGRPLRTILCLMCGCVANDPIPSDAELADFYRTDYRTEYKGSAQPRKRQIWRNFASLEEHMWVNGHFYGGRNRCLDLGSGSGEFLYMAQRLGMQGIGVEPDRLYAAYSREKLGLTILSQTLEESEFEADAFDMIRLNHVMEHMRDPVRSLKMLRRWLSDDGLIFINVPNLELEASQKLRGRIFHYGHIFNFSPRTFRAAARLAGLEEHPESASRLAREGCGFFRKGRTATAAEISDPEHAKHLLQLLKTHNERFLPAPRGDSAANRALSTASRRLLEMLEARRFSTPHAIADHFVARIASNPNWKPS